MIRIAFPGLGKRQGPKIFLSRVKDSINEQKLARTCSFAWPFYDIALFSSVARQSYGKPYVIRIDGIYFDSKETSGSNEELNSKIFDAIGGASGVIFQSDFNRRLVECFHGLPDSGSVVIPNGVDLKEFTPVGENHRKRLGIPEDARVLLTSASWRPHKRLQDVIAVFRLLHNENPGYHLVIIGDPPEDHVTGIENIHCAGSVDTGELPSWYRTGDIFLFLSWLDHCPNTVVEAIASGLPVVCSNQGGTRELVERANAGIVCEVDESYGFDMVDLYHPPSMDHQVIKFAVKKVSKYLDEYREQINRPAVDIDVAARRYVEFIEGCLV